MVIGIWNVLVEVVAALQYAEGSVKRQWLVDAVEISCVSIYPSMVNIYFFCARWKIVGRLFSTLVPIYAGVEP